MKEIADCCGLDGINSASRFIRKMVKIAEMCYFNQLEAEEPRPSQVRALLEELHNAMALVTELLRSIDTMTRREIEYQNAAVKEAQRQGSTSLDNIWSDEVRLEEEDGSVDDTNKVVQIYPGRPEGPGRKADWSETPIGRMRSSGEDLIGTTYSQLEYVQGIIKLAIEAQPEPTRGRPDGRGNAENAVRSILIAYEKLPGREAGWSKGHDGKLYSPFVRLVNVVLRPVLSSYWDDKSLDNTIKKVVKEHREKMKRISFTFAEKTE
jgi:hypothetical protein